MQSRLLLPVVVVFALYLLGQAPAADPAPVKDEGPGSSPTPKWTEAWRKPPMTAEEARELMRRLTLFVRKHHLKRSGDSPQRGMVYEYRDMRAGKEDPPFVQGEALDTMHDGAWLAAAMANALRATGEGIYQEMLTRWQLPFYLKMLNHSDELFSKRRVFARPDRRDVWSHSKVWLFQEGEKGFVPYWWDDGGSISLERHAGSPLPPFPCYDDFLDHGAENPRFFLSGYSLGCSNHMAQDLAVMLEVAWLLVRKSSTDGGRALAADLAEAAKNLHESRIRHHGVIPMCAAAAALATGDRELLQRVPDPDSWGHSRPRNAYWRGLYDFSPGQRVSLPGFADDAQYDYYHGVARAGGRLPKPLAFRLIYDALTTPLLYRCYSDDAPAPPGLHRFDLHPYYLRDGHLEDYRSDRKGPGGRPRPPGSRLGPQNLIVCGWGLQALDALPGVWEEAVAERCGDDVRVPLYDEVLGKRPVGREAVFNVGSTHLIVSSSRKALRIHGTSPESPLVLRIHSRPEGRGSQAVLTLERSGSVEARNDSGEELSVQGLVEPSGQGVLFRLDLPYTVVKGQGRWANGVELGRYSFQVGDERRDFCLASSEDRVRALLQREIAGGLRTWEAVFDAWGYVPTGIGAGSAGAGGRWEWEQLSDSGGYAHLISAAAQWIFYLTKQKDWELLRVPGEDGGSPKSGVQTLLGYVLHLPPEAPERRQKRLEIVRERRAGTPILVHRGASRIATENTLEAYAAAMDRGADGIEVDVRRSRDGVLYCLHDGSLERTTRGKGSVRDRTYFEILEAGVRDMDSGPEGPRVPTFASVLALARSWAALLHLDVKEAGLQPAIERLLTEGGLWEHVVMINPGNAEKLCADPRAELLDYKGWFPDTEGEPTEEVVREFLAREGDMVFTKEDPAPAARALGRRLPGTAVPVPESLRVEWSPVGPQPSGSAAGPQR